MHVDFLDQNNRVLDQHPRQREQPQQGGKAERQPREQQAERHADDRHRNNRPDYSRLTQLAKQQNRDQQHCSETERHLFAQRFLRIAGALEFAAPFHHIAGRQLNGLDLCTDLGEYAWRGQPIDNIGVYGDRLNPIASLNDGVLGQNLETVDQLHQRKIILNGT